MDRGGACINTFDSIGTSNILSEEESDAEKEEESI